MYPGTSHFSPWISVWPLLLFLALCVTDLCRNVFSQVPTLAGSQSLHPNHKRRRIMPRPRKWLLSKSNWEVSTARGNAHQYEPFLLSVSCFVHPLLCLRSVHAEKGFPNTVGYFVCAERGGRAWRRQRFWGWQHEQRFHLRGIQQSQQPQQKEAVQEQTQEEERYVSVLWVVEIDLNCNFCSWSHCSSLSFPSASSNFPFCFLTTFY